MSNPGLWKTWQGRIVDGKFPLRQWLGGSEHSAVFLTERPGHPSSRAALKLIAADGAEAERQLARWRSASQLSHHHLMRIYEFGRCRLDSSSLLYVVMEFAEEDLSQILPQRPLAPAEVTDLLPPVLDALSYLHGKGFVHSRIKPSNVVAIGDQLKLSCDQVMATTETNSARRRRDAFDAPETAAGIVSPASDVWSVGVSLVAALTQNISFADQQSPNDPDPPAAVPEPFRGIARECLHLDPKRRCSIAQIQARLQPLARSVPASAAQTVSHQPRSPLKRGPIAATVVIALLIVLVVFFSRGKSGTSAPSPTSERSPSQAPPQSAPTPEPNPTLRDSAASRKSPAAEGGVVHQVVPDISQRSRNTISGTIKVAVRVEADSAGKVRTAKLKTAGPSRYFAEQALKAAQGWEFVPLQVDGQSAPSTWLVQFRFRRSGTQASAERVTR